MMSLRTKGGGNIRKLTMALLPIAALVAIALMASGGVRTAHAQPACVELQDGTF